MPTAIVASRNTTKCPEFAGSTWVRLQYVLGLRRLGVECFWVDRLDAFDPISHAHSLDYLMDRFEHTARAFGFNGCYCVVYNNGEKYFGLTKGEYVELTGRADLLLNLGGHLPPDSPLLRPRRRAYVDVDPGFTQIWATEWDMWAGHNFFFTVGQNVGRAEFRIPTGGVDWRPILPPVVLDQWPAHVDERCRRFTTVADWRASQWAKFEGQMYGPKREEVLRFLRLPQEIEQRIEIALCLHSCEYEDRRTLVEHKWQLADPFEVASDPQSYREYIQNSRGEFSVAKSGYVLSNSGWVSDRTACYLASGKPALVQATGFEEHLRTGQGLLTFRTIEEAIAGLKAIDGAYLAHANAARALAEKYFNSDIVLSSVLGHVGL
jgi:hypothetical protein